MPLLHPLDPPRSLPLRRNLPGIRTAHPEPLRQLPQTSLAAIIRLQQLPPQIVRIRLRHLVVFAVNRHPLLYIICENGLATWFITSSDSGTLVITTLLSMGDRHPPRRFRIVWGLGVGLVAAVLLLADGLHALQTAAIAAALPVSMVLLLMIAGLLKSLMQDP